LVLADKLSAVTAEETKIKTIARFKDIPKKKKHTVTYDNGSTFSEYELTERETGLEVLLPTRIIPGNEAAMKMPTDCSGNTSPNKCALRM